MLKDPVRFGELCRVCGPVRVLMLCLRVWPCVCVWRMAGVAGVCVCVREKKGGARGGPPFFCGVQAAVSYSPTPWRVQYHRRWQS